MTIETSGFMRRLYRTDQLGMLLERFLSWPRKPGGNPKASATRPHCPRPTRLGKYAQQKAAPENRIARTWPSVGGNRRSVAYATAPAITAAPPMRTIVRQS